MSTLIGIDNDGKKGEGAVTDELGCEPTLVVPPDAGEEEPEMPTDAAGVLQLIHDKIKQKLYSEKDLQLFMEDPLKAIENEAQSLLFRDEILFQPINHERQRRREKK
jgi:hypothetical protein